MIKGQHRKMFRKPGLARQALGILASSGELMNEVQPRMRMAQAGAVNKSLFDQATRMVDGMIASGQAPAANRDAAINNLYRYYENQVLMNPRPAAPRMQGYMDPADGPIDTTGVRGLPAAIANYQGEGIGSMIGPEKPDTVLVSGPTASDIALDATAPVREAGRAVGRNVKQGLENLADTVSRDAQSTADAIMAPNEAARAVRGDGIAVFDPNYKPPMPEAGEAVTEGMRNLKETVSRDTGSWLDSIRSLGARLAEPSDKEKEEQKTQDRLDQQAQLAEMLKAGGVKDDEKIPARGLTGDGKDIIQTSVDGPNEDEDDPPKTGESLSKTASKGEKDSVKNFIEQFEEVTGDDNEENFWNAVMMAGLGIAAGDSDDAVMNIAKGALVGLQQYAKDQKDDKKTKFMNRMKMIELDLMQQGADARTMQAEAAKTQAEARQLAASTGNITDYSRRSGTIRAADELSETDPEQAARDMRTHFAAVGFKSDDILNSLEDYGLNFPSFDDKPSLKEQRDLINSRTKGYYINGKFYRTKVK